MDMQVGSRERATPLWYFESVMGHFFQVSLGQSSCFAGSKFGYGISQGPPICAFLSQDGIQGRDMWLGWHQLPWGDTPSLLTSIEPFWTCVVGKVSLTLKMRNLWFLSGQESARLSLLLFEYLSTGHELCLSQGLSVSCFKTTLTWKGMLFYKTKPEKGKQRCWVDLVQGILVLRVSRLHSCSYSCSISVSFCSFNLFCPHIR